MTVTAIDAVVANVMLMTELNGLLSFHPLASIPSRTIEFDGDPKQSNNDKNRAVDSNLR